MSDFDLVTLNISLSRRYTDLRFVGFKPRVGTNDLVATIEGWPVILTAKEVADFLPRPQAFRQLAVRKIEEVRRRRGAVRQQHFP